MADGEKCFPPPPGSGESISGGTFYQILGVPPTAELDEIKLSYKKLALKLHPDKNRDDPNATERFQELQEAYDVLQDPERRKAYDQNSDFILRAFSESDSDDSSVNFLSVPSSRTFWCLIVEAVLNDDGKSITAYAQQLEDEVFDEISKGGVCGFTWLHFAGYAGKPRAAKALIDLGVDVNAKTQPLCVTASQQFCRPTPLDLTYFIANKKVRENTLKVLQQADAAFGGVDMAKLESVWQGLIKNQLTLLKEEVLKFTEKIPVGVRRVLLKEARWRDIITFPGEDAKTMESKRTRRAMKAMANKVVWVLIGDKSMTAKARLGAILGNVFVFLLVWWLFNFDKFQLVQTVLIAVLFMCLASSLRYVDPNNVWQSVPSREQVYEMLPPREKVEAWALRGWGYCCAFSDAFVVVVLFLREEACQAYDLGVSEYFEDARQRAGEFYDGRIQASTAADLSDDEASPAERKKRSPGIANRIAKRVAERGAAAAVDGARGGSCAGGAGLPPTAAASDAKRPGARGRRRPPGRGG